MGKRNRSTIIWAVVAMALLAADQLSKWAVAAYLKGQPPLVLIDGVLELVYTENTGAAFGAFAGGNTFLIAAGILMVAALVWLWLRLPAGKKWNRLRCTGLVLLAGAVGNLIDRFVYGFVVDFIYFVPINFPKFNLADSCLTLSLVVLFCLLVWGYSDGDLKEVRLFGKPEKPEEAEAPEKPEEAEAPEKPEAAEAQEAAGAPGEPEKPE